MLGGRDSQLGVIQIRKNFVEEGKCPRKFRKKKVTSPAPGKGRKKKRERVRTKPKLEKGSIDGRRNLGVVCEKETQLTCLFGGQGV